MIWYRLKEVSELAERLSKVPSRWRGHIEAERLSKVISNRRSGLELLGELVSPMEDHIRTAHSNRAFDRASGQSESRDQANEIMKSMTMTMMMLEKKIMQLNDYDPLRFKNDHRTFHLEKLEKDIHSNIDVLQYIRNRFENEIQSDEITKLTILTMLNYINQAIQCVVGDSLDMIFKPYFDRICLAEYVVEKFTNHTQNKTKVEGLLSNLKEELGLLSQCLEETAASRLENIWVKVLDEKVKYLENEEKYLNAVKTADLEKKILTIDEKNDSSVQATEDALQVLWYKLISLQSKSEVLLSELQLISKSHEIESNFSGSQKLS